MLHHHIGIYLQHQTTLLFGFHVALQFCAYLSMPKHAEFNALPGKDQQREVPKYAKGFWTGTNDQSFEDLEFQSSVKHVGVWLWNVMILFECYVMKCYNWNVMKCLFGVLGLVFCCSNLGAGRCAVTDDRSWWIFSYPWSLQGKPIRFALTRMYTVNR